MSHAALNVAPDPHITILDVAAIPIFDVRQHLLGAATNLARLATLGLTHHNGWVAHHA
jgi:hypothetical protein